MSKVGIVYFSGAGHTAKLARYIKDGVLSVDALQVYECRITKQSIDSVTFVDEALVKLTKCDAIIFGSPTYMGSVAAAFKAFADATFTIWQQQQWAGKLAAGFTSGCDLHGDQAMTLQYLSMLATKHGMLWLNLPVTTLHNPDINRSGCQLGATSCTIGRRLHPVDINTAEMLGLLVATHIKQKAW